MIKDTERFNRADKIADSLLQLIKLKTAEVEWYTAPVMDVRLDLINYMKEEVTVGQVRHALAKLRNKGLIVSERRLLHVMDTTCSYKPLQQ